MNVEALCNHYQHLCVLDSNKNANRNRFIHSEKIIAIGTIKELEVSETGNLKALQQFIDENKNNWLFGFLTYDLKNEIELLHSNNSDQLQFPVLHFFVPEIVLQAEAEKINVFYNDSYTTAEEAEKIYALALSPVAKTTTNKEKRENKRIIHSKITKENYIASINRLKQHIKKGDIYEVNFCQEFYAENTTINSSKIYEQLNEISQAPFSAFYKLNDKYLLCASPERFLQKTSNHLISQPIKGTAKRSAMKAQDEQLKEELAANEKEKSENVMIVDLVRNDLSKIAKRGTVNVDELFGVYSFKQVHQMISTVSCDLKEDVLFTDIINSTFPMGSMTGAPKISAMQLIEKYESSKRGLYSGSVGYISPNGDFDFNVVIRSILYNETNKYVSFMVGSAITDKANAESEYEECLLKAKALFEVLKSV